MNEITLKTLNKLQRGKISLKKACKLLKKTPKQIDELFDSEEYFYIHNLKDEKEIFEIEKENIKNLMKIVETKEKFIFDLSKDIGREKFIVTNYFTQHLEKPNLRLKTIPNVIIKKYYTFGELIEDKRV